MQRLVQDTIAMVPTKVVTDNYDENAACVQDTGTDSASAANMNRRIAKFQFSAADKQLTCTDNTLHLKYMELCMCDFYKPRCSQKQQLT